MSHEVPFVWYDPISGERNVVGQCVVEEDGTFSVVIEDELIADALQATIGPMSFEPASEIQSRVFADLEKPPEFKIKFDPGKFDVRGPLNELGLEPGTSIWDEVNNDLFPHRNEKKEES